jgi:pyridinium-3,5-bisthiocarboxylic acid mononucleotide nickel chelatase
LHERQLRFEKDRIALLETNVDDVTGEILGHAIDTLLMQGAFDASAVPFMGKKGRPGFTVRVTCNVNSVEKFARILVRETGSFGVKSTIVDRLKVPRRQTSESILVRGKLYRIRLKIGAGTFRSKPEFEDAKKIAVKTGLPLRKVLEIISQQIEEKRNSE